MTLEQELYTRAKELAKDIDTLYDDPDVMFKEWTVEDSIVRFYRTMEKLRAECK